METPHRLLLDRDLARAWMQAEHQDSLDLMDEIANYGSNLILRCLEDSEKDVTATVVLGVLLRHGVAMLDATAALCREGSVTCAWPCTRALLEALVSAKYILQGDSVNRARHYYVWNLRQQRRWARRIAGGSKEAVAFQHVWDRFGIAKTPEETEIAQEEERRLTEALARPIYSEIDKTFERSEKPSHDGWWFRPLGPNSIRQVAEKVELLSEFDLVYSEASEIAHGTNYRNSIVIGKGEASILPLRSFDRFEQLFSFSLSIAFLFYRRVLDVYRKGEETNFARKYSEEWQARFMRGCSSDGSSAL